MSSTCLNKQQELAEVEYMCVKYVPGVLIMSVYVHTHTKDRQKKISCSLEITYLMTMGIRTSSKPILNNLGQISNTNSVYNQRQII